MVCDNFGCLVSIYRGTTYVLMQVYNRLFSAQNKGWKLVSHSIKIGTLLWTIIGSPLEMYNKICPIKLDFARSYAEVGRKMTCDRPLF